MLKLLIHYASSDYMRRTRGTVVNSQILTICPLWVQVSYRLTPVENGLTIRLRGISKASKACTGELDRGSRYDK